MPEVLASLTKHRTSLNRENDFTPDARVIFWNAGCRCLSTILGPLRWTEKGGSYRAIQRFYQNLKGGKQNELFR